MSRRDIRKIKYENASADFVLAVAGQVLQKETGNVFFDDGYHESILLVKGESNTLSCERGTTNVRVCDIHPGTADAIKDKLEPFGITVSCDKTDSEDKSMRPCYRGMTFWTFLRG